MRGFSNRGSRKDSITITHLIQFGENQDTLICREVNLNKASLTCLVLVLDNNQETAESFAAAHGRSFPPVLPLVTFGSLSYDL